MQTIDADHNDYNNLFHTQIGVQRQHTVLEFKYSVQDKNDCPWLGNVSSWNVYRTHRLSSLVTETFELWTLTVQVLSHCWKQNEHRACLCVLNKKKTTYDDESDIDPGFTLTSCATRHRSTMFATFAAAAAVCVSECWAVR